MCTTTFTVAGMTCSHCVMSVTEEVSQIAGVQDVDVALDTGRLTVTSQSDLDHTRVQEAVEEAGYRLVAS